MRTVYLFMMTTIDGYHEGPDHDLSWLPADSDFDEFVLDQNRKTGTAVFGRRTYELMVDYWTKDAAYDENPAEVVEFMRDVEKVVVSRTLESVDWNNTRLVRENPAGELRRLKEGEGGDIAIFGSSNLAGSLLKEGVIDELRIVTAPVVPGAGTPLFAGLGEQHGFELTSTRTIGKGHVLNVYR